MKAYQWLEQATRDLPAGVAARISRETLAHLQEAELPYGTDVREVLDDPEPTNDELRRLYLTVKELENLATSGPLRTGLNLTEWLAGLVFPAVLLDQAMRSGAQPSGLGAAVLLVGLALTWDLHPVRRRQWRVLLMVLIAGWLEWMPRVWSHTGWPMVYAPLFAVLVIAYSTYQHLRRDSRVRRTLQVEQGRA